MTGNVSAFASSLALADMAKAAAYLALVLLFILGAVVCTMAVEAGRRLRVSHTYAVVVLAEALLLAVLAVIELLSAGWWQDAVLAYGLSFLMGLQNAMVTQISGARVRTTHVTGMVTDIGIELGHIAVAALHGSSRGAVRDRTKLWLHSFTVACFALGGLLGVVAYRFIGTGVLFCAAAVLFALAVTQLAAAQPKKAA